MDKDFIFFTKVLWFSWKRKHFLEISLHFGYSFLTFYCIARIVLTLASFEADQRPYRSSAANHVGAAVFAHVAPNGRLDAVHRWTKLKQLGMQFLQLSLELP